MKKLPFILLIAAASLAACNNTENKLDANDSAAINSISEESFVNAVKTLSSDEFEGRMPFTEGETKTINYIKEQFESIGLEPGNGDSYFQEVPLVETTSSPMKELVFKGKGGEVSFKLLEEFVMGSRQVKESVTVNNSELIFAGFGIVAPEYNWNDYANLDVKGKTVVVMVNDPGYYDKSLFKGGTMTYYGRWTYKYEEAARQGASGVLIIHDTGAASYGWNVVRSGWSGPQMNLLTADDGASLAAFEGWLSADAAKKMFNLAGIDSSVIESAKKPGFKAVDLGLQTNVSIKNEIKKATSNNVIGKLEGTKRPDEVIIYAGHWDHLGVGESLDGDSIYNGANDNATGIAAIMEIAKAFKHATVPPERTILFVGLTAEEQGLLGSEYYAKNPIYPLSKTVANINIDAMSAFGATKDITVIGYGQSELDDYVEHAAELQDRTIRPDPHPSSGSFFRSDHFNFAKVGVPALYAGGGIDFVDTSTEAQSKRDQFEGRYHTQKDEYDAAYWQLDGIINDIKLFYQIGYSLSMETTFPKWRDGSEFKEAGENR
ncbi:M28 family metallopeptidase [Albibacterium sp.]|uniref:M28 family metallopeptidase n=1 Tax=Albibacterium sp. TaxID=2952885 RepID=UPI002C570A5F|nr:M28 family metallopeptidase [Albibacterium sp.]HUH17725.1 M28 family metallopeptidase [Albibacterium sp.]